MEAHGSQNSQNKGHGKDTGFIVYTTTANIIQLHLAEERTVQLNQSASCVSLSSELHQLRII